jgi:hypothetical protein
VALLLQFAERLRNVLPNKGRGRLACGIETAYVIVTAFSHLRVLEGSGQDTSLPGDAPIANGLVYQEVKQRVIRRGYGAAQARLFGVVAILADKWYACSSRSSANAIS